MDDQEEFEPAGARELMVMDFEHLQAKVRALVGWESAVGDEIYKHLERARHALFGPPMSGGEIAEELTRSEEIARDVHEVAERLEDVGDLAAAKLLRDAAARLA